MGEKIRSFIAVDISGEVKLELSRLLTVLKSKINFNIKWVKPEQMHLTLAFLGEVSPDFLEKTKAQLNGVAYGFRQFKCQLKGLGAFPSSQQARVIWAGVAYGAEELKKVQSAVVKSLIEIGYKPEKRQFSPHLTLGRLKTVASLASLNEIDFISSIWQIRDLMLFKSELYPNGPVYTALGRFSFKE